MAQLRTIELQLVMDYNSEAIIKTSWRDLICAAEKAPVMAAWHELPYFSAAIVRQQHCWMDQMDFFLNALSCHCAEM